MKFIQRILCVALTASIFFVDQAHSKTIVVDDPVVYSFVVVGCNRIDKDDVDLSKNPSTANVVQLNRTFADVAALTPKPNFFFFAGDMVLGYTDSVALTAELNTWKALYEKSPLKKAGIELIAIPGNHESQDSKKTAQPYSEHVWINTMADYIKRGGNGPKADPTGPDSLMTDQSYLNYSFNFKDAHFVILSTDPAGRDWRPPSHWIANDVAAAHANSQIKHIFAIGHKPAYAWDYNVPGAKNDGLNKFAENRDILWKSLDDNNADAMVVAHNHVYSAFRPTNKTWMVVAGNGGSKLEKNVPPEKQFYGFTLIQVLKSGKVIEKSYGRNLGASYVDPSPEATFPTTVRETNVLSGK